MTLPRVWVETNPSDMSELRRARYDSQRLPTTLPHEKLECGSRREESRKGWTDQSVALARVRRGLSPPPVFSSLGLTHHRTGMIWEVRK